MERILFIRRAGAYGGIEVLLLDWIRSINYDVNEVIIASTMDCFTGKISEYDIPAEYKTVPLPVVGGFFGIFRSWFREIREIAPDKIIILQSNITEVPLPSVLAAFIATRGNVFMTEHVAWPFPPEKARSVHFGFLPGLGLWWYKMMWGMRLRSYFTRRVLAVSEAVKGVLLMYGYPERKISIVYHGVDTDRFSPAESSRTRWRRQRNIPEDAVVLVSTSRLAQEKRLERLIHAFDALSGRHPNLWLLFAGEGPLRKELEDSTGSVNGWDRVIFLGLADDVPELLRASDFFVLPSDREGLSVSLTEAMSTGLVCIATDISGSNEVIRDGENGFLVATSDEGVLAGLEKAIRLDETTKKRIVRNARNTILERFEKKKSVCRILTLLDIESTSDRP